MFATTAFGIDIDLDEVRMVVHIGSAYKQACPESGRAGREGLYGLSLVLDIDDNFNSLKSQNWELSVEFSLTSFLEASCRRNLLGEFRWRRKRLYIN